MGKIKTELSIKNENHIDSNLYLENKYFCLQYPKWKRESAQLSDELIRSSRLDEPRNQNGCSDPTGNIATKKAEIDRKINLIESTAKETDTVLDTYIIKGVTEGVSYDYLKLMMNIPCSRGVYYKMYRLFFKLLSEKR